MISGALLAGSGAAFQMLFRNQLAEPGIIGISSGATLGAIAGQTIGNIAGLSAITAISGINFFAFCGSILTGLLLCAISSFTETRNPVTLLLSGTALGTLFSAISSILLLSNSNQLTQIYMWLLGSFNGRGWNELYFILIPAFFSIMILLVNAGKLDLLSSGNEQAQSLGLNTKQLQSVVLIASCLAVSSVSCAGGTINFVGLIAPHITRRLFGPSRSKAGFLISFSMLFGSILVILSDTFGRTVISPGELPAGLITSFLGAPFFLFLIFSRKKEL